MSKKYNIAIVGATGLVGRTMAKVLEERNFPYENIKFLASQRSAGKTLIFNEKPYTVEELTESSFEGLDFALFSAGSGVSKQFAPIAAKSGCIVIDNSSAWRQDPDIPLVVPEVNSEALKSHNNIIANPNCSTIQLMLPLKAINDKFKLKRVICSTYQSISGAGQKGIDKLTNEINLTEYTENPIAYNTLFHKFEENGWTEEENKMAFESRKILNLPDLKAAFTCVRLPIKGGHAESVNFETEKPFTIEELNVALANQTGLVLQNTDLNNYATPYSVDGKDEVFVSRVRKDNSAENSAYMWVVADNLRKGAATNTVQIAQKIIEMNLV